MPHKHKKSTKRRIVAANSAECWPAGRFGVHEGIDAKLKMYDLARWKVACEEMLIRLANGNLEAAHRVLDQYAIHEQPALADMGTAVTAILPARVANLLYANGFTTIATLHWATDQELLAIPGLNDLTLESIRKKVASVVAGQCLMIPPDDYLESFFEEQTSE